MSHMSSLTNMISICSTCFMYVNDRTVKLKKKLTTGSSMRERMLMVKKSSAILKLLKGLCDYAKRH